MAEAASPHRLVDVLDDLSSSVIARSGCFDLTRSQSVLEYDLQKVLQHALRAKSDLRGQDGLAGDSLDDLVNAIDGIARSQISTGAFTQALALDRHALAVRRAQFADPHPALAGALWNVARDHFQLGEYDAAARLGEEALSIATAAFGGADPRLLPHLERLAVTYEQLGRHREARADAERALALAEASFGPTDGRTVPAIHTLASIARATGRLREAHVAAERALGIQRAAFGEDSLPVAAATGLLATIVAQIGERDRARQMFEQVRETLGKLPQTRHVESEIATVLANLAGLAAPDAALRLYEEAVALRRAASGPDHPETIRTLSHFALLLLRRGDYRRALAIWEECLEVRRRLLGDLHPDVARSLADMAFPLAKLGNVDRATGCLLEALAILGCHDIPQVTARTNVLLATIVKTRSTAAAILLVKHAVNALQRQRRDAAALGTDAHHAYVSTREQSYRQLGNALIVSGRLPEAQQVLAMLKEAELVEITDGNLGPRVMGASLTPLEARWIDRSEHIHERFKSQFDNSRSNRLGGAAGGDDEVRLALARRQCIDELKQWLENLLADFRRTESDVISATARSSSVDSGAVLRSNVPPRTAVLQYLLSADHLQIIFSASNVLRHHDVAFDRGEIHRLVYDLRTQLRDGSDGFFASARRLYDLLIEPVISDLRAAGVHTLILSLDGVLRYLPVCALFDGTRYLLDMYALVLAAGEPYDAVRPPSGERRGAGLGVTRAVGPHKALLGVREELAAVIRTDDHGGGVVSGIIRLDEAFSSDAFREALSAHYSVIHIASHFVFQAAQEASSYLLLGDGSKLTLAELSRWNFEGVELMVLSACDTAAGGGHEQSGREIEGLGALMRRQGARNVIATLWPVRDFTTAAIMRAFYQYWCEQGLAPAEALRQAQLSLRRKNDAPSPVGETRAFTTYDDGQEAGRWAHPRYWAPYVLMGEPWQDGAN